MTVVAKAPDPLRAQLARSLEWKEAHVSFDEAIAGIPPERRGSLAAGFEHSVWQLLEHLRLAQKDLLDFCVNDTYVHTMKWPDDYWPRDPSPADPRAWDTSVERFTADREKLKAVALNDSIDLHAPVPTGNTHQTYLRALLLVIDHNAYHLGQLVAVRRALGIWGS
jgi:uncharacterized damage-inducible protein DinB